MKNTLLIFALLLAQSVGALEIQITSGEMFSKDFEYSATKTGGGYSENNALYVYLNQREATFEFRNKGGRIELVDLKHNITFVVDLNNSREQDLSPQYLEFLKKESKYKDFAKAIERITLSDLKSANVAGSDKIIGKANYYVNYRMASGTVLKAKLQVSVSLETQQLYARQFLDLNGNPAVEDIGSGESRIIQVPVLVGSFTGDAKVLSVDMGNAMTNMVVKSVLELVMNILPDAFKGSSVLFYSNGY